MCNHGKAGDDSGGCTKVTYLVIAALFLSSSISYADRSNMSIAIVPMSAEHNSTWGSSSVNQGLVLSSFYYGYIAMQVPSGWLVTHYSPHLVLLVASVAWASATILPSLVSASLALLIVSRAVMGLFEAAAYPAIYSLIAMWVPKAKRSIAVAVIMFGNYIGICCALFLSPVIVSGLTWHWVFYLFGGVGLVWSAMWACCCPRRPSEARLRLAEQERRSSVDLVDMSASGSDDDSGGNRRGRTTAGGTAATSKTAVTYQKQKQEQQGRKGGGGGVKKAKKKVPWRLLLTSRRLWALYVVFMTNGWGYNVLISLLPKFFLEKYDVEFENVGIYSALPYVVQGSTAVFTGLAADAVINRCGLSLTTARKIFMAISQLGPALGMVGLLFSGSPAGATACLCFGLAANTAILVSMFVVHLDVIPAYAGVTFAIANSLGQIPGLVAVPISGAVLDATGSWTVVFVIPICLYAVGAFTFTLMGSAEELVVYDSLP